jgi:hypothetical protein
VRKWIELTVVVATAVVALTGCSDEGDGPDAVPTITTKPSTPAASTTSPSATTSSPGTTTTAPSTPTEPTAPPSSAETSESAPRPTGTPTATADTGRGPTTYGAAVDRIDRADDTRVTAARFATPGDSVYCLLEDDVIGPSCELRTGFIEEESFCGGGATNGVGRIETLDGRAQPVCNTDTIREPGARVVGPVAVVVARGGAVRCVVEQLGVTCVDTAARTGFFLTPGEYHVFDD